MRDRAKFVVRWACQAAAEHSRIRTVLVATLLVASIGGMLVLLHNGVAAVPWQTLRARPGFLLLALIATVLASASGAKYWQCLLSAVGVELPFVDAMRIWCLSNVAKYGLGAVTQYGGRLFMTEHLGLNRRSSAASIVLEVLLILASGVLMLLFMAPLAQQAILPAFLLPLTSLGPIVGTLGFGMILLYPDVLFRVLPAHFRPPVAGVGRAKVAQALAVVAVNWILLGISAFLVIQSIVSVPLAIIPSVIFAVTLAMISGLLALTPLGAGVREVTLALLLAHFIPAPVAVLSALVHRLLSVLAELVLAVPFIVARTIKRRNSSSRPLT